MEISEPFYQFLDLISDIAIGFYNSNPLIKVMQINQESIGFKYSSILKLIQDSNTVKSLKEAVWRVKLIKDDKSCEIDYFHKNVFNCYFKYYFTVSYWCIS